jgi:hypothetical protein
MLLQEKEMIPCAADRVADWILWWTLAVIFIAGGTLFVAWMGW